MNNCLIDGPAGSRPMAMGKWLTVELLTELLESILVVFLLAQTLYSAAYMFTQLVGFLCAGLAAAFVLRKAGVRQD